MLGEPIRRPAIDDYPVCEMFGGTDWGSRLLNLRSVVLLALGGAPF